MTTSGRNALTLGAVVAAIAVLWPMAAAGQEPGADDDRAGARADAVVGLDVLKAEHVEVISALDDVEANVATQRVQLDEATARLRTARSDAAAADAAVREAQARVDALVAETDEIVIEAFVSPQTDVALDALAAPTLNDATVKRMIIDRRLASDAELLEELQEARAELEGEAMRREELAAAAEARRSDAEAALADVEAAVSQQVAFVLAVEARMDRALTEAEGVEPVDPELAEQMRRREAELTAVLRQYDSEVQARLRQERAAALAAQSEVARRSGEANPPVPGGVVTVTCPSGGSFEVAGDISEAVGDLLAAASADGLTMCATTGYRSYAVQVAARRANCGTSSYAMYSAPASSCSPPTARPGTSLHEQGLAIDFTCDGQGIGTSSPCFAWLAENAFEFGLMNLPSEPWHWSVSGD